MGTFGIEYLNENGKTTPLVCDADDINKAVPLKAGRKVARMATAIKEVLDEVGRDYGVSEEVLYAPYKIIFSFHPFPRYFGLKNGTDSITIPRYLGEKAAKHEGGHMAHRRILEHRLREKGEGLLAEFKSERELEKATKKDIFLCEQFADKYSGLRSHTITAGSLSFVTGSSVLTKVSSDLISTATEAAQSAQDVSLDVAAFLLLLFSTYLSGRLVVGYFGDLKEIDL